MNREELIKEIRANCLPKGYSKEIFELEKWILETVVFAYDEGWSAGYLDGFSDGYDRGEEESEL